MARAPMCVVATGTDTYIPAATWPPPFRSARHPRTRPFFAAHAPSLPSLSMPYLPALPPCPPAPCRMHARVVLRLMILMMLAVLAVPPAARTAWGLASRVLAAWRRWASSSSHPAAAGAPGAGGGPAGRCAAMSAAQAAHITGARGDAGGAGGGWGVWAVCVFHGAWDAAAGLAARVQLALVDAAAALRHGPQAVSEPASPAAAAQAGVAAVCVVTAQALWSVGVVAGALVLSMSGAALCCEGCEFAVEVVLSEGAWLRRVVGRRGAARRLANGSRAEAWQLMMYFWVSLLVRWVTGVGFWPLAGAMLAAGLVAELLR